MVGQVEPQRQIQKPWWMALFITVSIGLCIAFWLPTQFSPPVADSDSYLFGFSNRLYQLILLLVLTTVALFAKLGRLSYPPSRRNEEGGSGKLSGRLIAVCVGTASFIAAIYYWLAGQVNGFVNTDYYLDRIHLIASGKVPFRDFEFIYGSAPLYLSLFLGRWLHISADHGYYLVWGAATITGVWLLGLSIRWLELPSGGKRLVFLLTYLLFVIMISMVTMNYCALRYTLPLFAITGLCRIDCNSRWWTRVAVVLFGAGMTAVLIGFSPDEGIVYATAVCLYLPARRYFAQRSFILDALVLVAMIIGIGFVAARAGSFTTMQRLASDGAWYLPVYPGPHILTTLAAILITVFYLVSGSTAKRLQSNVAFATIYSLGMLPGALGRCDAVHVVGCLLPLVICAMLLTWLWIPAWRVAVCSYLISFIVLPTMINRVWGPPTSWDALQYRLYHKGEPQGRFDKGVSYLITRLVLIKLGEQRGSARIHDLKRGFAWTVTDPHNLFPGASPVVAAPFGFRPDGIHNYQASDINEGYFEGMLNVLTVNDVNRKIDDLRMHPNEDLVITKQEVSDSCELKRGDRKAIRGLLQLPWVPQPKRELSIFVPYCNYIRNHYQFIYSTSDTALHYGLMRRRPVEPRGD